jgi:hypothetical protein
VGRVLGFHLLTSTSALAVANSVVTLPIISARRLLAAEVVFSVRSLSNKVFSGLRNRF